MVFNEHESINEVYIAKNSRKIAEENEPSNVGPLKLKVYRRRWLMLAIYFICSVGSLAQMTEYGTISNIISRYHISLQNHIINIKPRYS